MVQALAVLCAALLAPLAPLAPAPLAPNAPLAPLALFLLGHLIGTERAEIARDGDRSVLTVHFEYLDRGTKVALDTTLAFAKDFTPLSFESHGKSYRYFSVDASVPKIPGTPATFTLDGMAPISAQALLVRYWLAHGRPEAITLLPSRDTVRIREYPPIKDVTYLHGHEARPYTIEGVIWGAESLLLDAVDLDIVAAATTAGILPFDAVASELPEGLANQLVTTRRRQTLDRAARRPSIPPLQGSRFALTGGRLIDATGAPAIERATVVVRDGRIEAAGPASLVQVPRGVAVMDVSGKSVLPGLWDMHAHIGQAEWGPVYLASGVTTARDMGGELDAVTALRDAWKDAGAIGPRLLLAGLVDGPGPASFGLVTAGNPDEGRSVVRKYKAAGFQQMKLYSLLDRPTVAAIIEAAHGAGMTVTGHIPTSLTGGLREAVDMGMDHIAHLTVRDAPGSDALRETIAFLKSHGTVIDPTVSWNEMLGRSAQTSLVSIQPGLEHVTQPLRRLLESANGGNVTPEQARDRLTRSLQIIKALHDAGVPIVAGTDKGVPGVSVAREIELYVQAGLTPMDAIRAATAVPARVMGLAADSGTIAPGLRADLIVVDGNPLDRISDIRNVTMVSANGRLFATAPLWKAGGFKP
jgi:imidazolonepropionase-like amidohydrolase